MLDDVWHCYRDGQEVVTITRSRERRYKFRAREKRLGMNIEQSLDEVVKRKTRDFWKAYSLSLTPAPIVPFEVESAFPDADSAAWVHPVINGVRCLAYWHRGRIKLQLESGHVVKLPEIIDALRGPVDKGPKAGPLQPGVILDGWLTVKDEDGHDAPPDLPFVGRRLPLSIRRARYHVADVFALKPQGYLKRSALILKRVDGGQIVAVRAMRVTRDMLPRMRSCILRPDGLPYLAPGAIQKVS